MHANLTQAKPSVAIVGVGNMGLSMAKALLAQHLTVVGCDIDPKANAVAQGLGVQMRASPSQAAALADVMLIAVVNAKQIAVVLQDLLPVLGTAHTVLLMSTIAPDDVRGFVERILLTGAQAIDAPMSGGPKRAEQGQLTLMLAAPAHTLERVDDVVRVLANGIFVMGHEPGTAMKAKLLNNVLAGVHLAAAAQVLRMAGELGLDEATFLQLTQSSSGQSWIADDRLKRVLAKDTTPRAQLHILGKDVRLAHELMQKNGFQMPLAKAALDMFNQAQDIGLANEDDGALYHLPLPIGSQL